MCFCLSDAKKWPELPDLCGQKYQTAHGDKKKDQDRASDLAALLEESAF